MTIDDTGTPAFPFIVAGEYYGVVGSGFSPNGSASATDYFNAGTAGDFDGPFNPIALFLVHAVFDQSCPGSERLRSFRRPLHHLAW